MEIEEKVNRLIAGVADLVASANPISGQGMDIDEYAVPAPKLIRVLQDLEDIVGGLPEVQGVGDAGDPHFSKTVC